MTLNNLKIAPSQTLAQSQQHLLDLISQHLAKHGYQVIKHQRFSQYTCSEERPSLSHPQNPLYYQGLSLVTKQTKLAPHYLYKWQLTLLPTHNQAQTKTNDSYCNLYQEIQNLQSIYRQIRSTQQNLASSLDLVLPVVPFIDYHAATYHDDILITNEHKHWQCVGFVMPYFAAGSVKDYLVTNNSLPIRQKLQIAQAMANRLAQLHKLGWVHGDIKPSNFLLHHSDTIMHRMHIEPTIDQTSPSTLSTYQAYLNDLSCAFQIKDKVAMTELDSHNRADKIKNRLTPTRLSGTPAYIAPECWQGQPKSQPSDIYAFGITLYEILMQEKPFSPITTHTILLSAPVSDGSAMNKSVINSKIGNTNNQLKSWALAHCQQPVPLLTDLSNQLGNLYPKLQDIIDGLLAKQVENRYSCMHEVVNQLRQLSHSS